MNDKYINIYKVPFYLDFQFQIRSIAFSILFIFRTLIAITFPCRVSIFSAAIRVRSTTFSITIVIIPKEMASISYLPLLFLFLLGFLLSLSLSFPLPVFPLPVFPLPVFPLPVFPLPVFPLSVFLLSLFLFLEEDLSELKKIRQRITFCLFDIHRHFEDQFHQQTFAFLDCVYYFLDLCLKKVLFS